MFLNWEYSNKRFHKGFTLTFNTSSNGCVAVCRNVAALLQHEKCFLVISSGDELFSGTMGYIIIPYRDFAPRGWDDGHTEQNIYSLFRNRKESSMFGVLVAIWLVVSCFKELTNGNGFDDLYWPCFYLLFVRSRKAVAKTDRNQSLFLWKEVHSQMPFTLLRRGAALFCFWHTELISQ